MNPISNKRKKRVVKAWGALCTKDGLRRAFPDKYQAKEHASFLDAEYSGRCTHTVIPCTITYTLPKRDKRLR